MATNKKTKKQKTVQSLNLRHKIKSVIQHVKLHPLDGYSTQTSFIRIALKRSQNTGVNIPVYYIDSS